MRPFTFTTDLFTIDPREDEETNPFCYGKALAHWVRDGFLALGYTVEPVIAEDWGWCVMLHRKPFMLWIGCQNELPDALRSMSPEQKLTYRPNPTDLNWLCFVGKDVPPWTGAFWRRLVGLEGTRGATERAQSELHSLLRGESRIHLHTLSDA